MLVEVQIFRKISLKLQKTAVRNEDIVCLPPAFCSSTAPHFHYNFSFEPTRGYDLITQGKEKHLESEANSQVIPAVVDVVLKLLPVLVSGAKGLAKYVICDKLTQLQEYTNNEQKGAKIMVLVKEMDDLLDAKETNKIKKQLNMINNRVAEAELFDWAKDYLCD